MKIYNFVVIILFKNDKSNIAILKACCMLCYTVITVLSTSTKKSCAFLPVIFNSVPVKAHHINDAFSIVYCHRSFN